MRYKFTLYLLTYLHCHENDKHMPYNRFEYHKWTTHCHEMLVIRHSLHLEQLHWHCGMIHKSHVRLETFHIRSESQQIDVTFKTSKANKSLQCRSKS